MKLKMQIKNIKSINDLNIELPLDKGLYAITGQNGSGKSTVITCASSAYFNMQMNEYFGKTPDDASIFFESVTTGKAGGLTALEPLKAVYLTDQLTTIRWSPI